MVNPVSGAGGVNPSGDSQRTQMLQLIYTIKEMMEDLKTKLQQLQQDPNNTQLQDQINQLLSEIKGYSQQLEQDKSYFTNPDDQKFLTNTCDAINNLPDSYKELTSDKLDQMIGALDTLRDLVLGR